MKFQFLQKIKEGIKALFSKSKTASELAVKAVNAIKAAVDNPVADFVTFCIPGDTDDKILKVLRTYLPKIAIEFNLVNSALHVKATAEEILAELVKFLKNIPDSQRSEQYKTIAALLYKDMADKTMSVEEAIALTQYVYKTLKS